MRNRDNDRKKWKKYILYKNLYSLSNIADHKMFKQIQYLTDVL